MDFLASKLDNFLAVAGKIFLSYGSIFSLTSLLCAFAIACGHVIWRRRSRGRRIKLRTLIAGVFPRRKFMTASTKADVWMFAINGFLLGGIFSLAVLSSQGLFTGLSDVLVALFGAPTPSSMPDWLARCLVTLALFLAYELGYWLDHYLSHRVRFLWEFHKVHHSATHLTPLTAWRMHPVNSIVFANILMVSVTSMLAVTNYLTNGLATAYLLSGTNVILVIFVHLYVHLQHSEIWIPFRGVWGRIFMSPAHHQVHHSTNPVHFNKNMGSCLSLWDWVFGTLYVPAKENENLSFGIEASHDVHSLEGGLVTPFIDAGKHVADLIGVGGASAPAGGTATPRNT